MALDVYNWFLYRFSNAHSNILAGFGLLVFCLAIGRWLLPRQKWQSFAGVLCSLYWLFIVLSMTIIGRFQTAEPKVELRLFWCVRSAWKNREPMDWYFIIGNIVLFLPIGIILPIFFHAMRHWQRTALAGLLVSLAVELAQLAFRLGLFELDDIFNNTLGTLMGYGVFVLLMALFRREWIGTRAERIMLLAVWIAMAGFLAVSACMGQPVFDKELLIKGILAKAAWIRVLLLS